MSITAFQRRRREAEKENEKNYLQEETKQSKSHLEDLSVEEIKECTKDDIKARLDELEIEYKSSDNKDALIALLKLNEEPENDEPESPEEPENTEDEVKTDGNE